MSRFDEWNGDEDFNNEGYFWDKRAQLALEGRRGRKALEELRDALIALPEKRLIANALCTMGLQAEAEAMPAQITRSGWDGQPYTSENYERSEKLEILASQGEGVCAIGAFVWWQKVKGGMDPAEAFAALPHLIEGDAAGYETADIGKAHGLTYTLAYQLAYMNDEEWSYLTPEARFVRFLEFIDAQLRKPLLAKPPRRERKRRMRRVSIEPVYPAGTQPLQLGL